MRYPEFLKTGDRLGFIAPSFGVSGEPYESRFASALEFFESQGMQAVEGPNCRACDGVGKSSTAQACAAEINDFFINDRCDAIISCGGGETMCEDLSFVDFEKIAASRPRWFMGFSDNTNLTFTLPTLCDTAAIYGPCAPSFGKKPMHAYISDAWDILTGEKLRVSNYDKWAKDGAETEDPLAADVMTEDFRLRYGGTADSSAEFSGRLIGGCLDILQVLCGTEYDRTVRFAEKYASDGIIWFLEACDLNPMGIRRAVWQLRNAGWFENAKGFLIGRALNYDMDFMGMDRINAVTGALEDLGLPIVLDLDIGHLPPSMPLISGAMADVKAEGNSISINMRLE